MYLKNASRAKKWQIQAETSTVNNRKQTQRQVDKEAMGVLKRRAKTKERIEALREKAMQQCTKGEREHRN